jgi:hypothetical protein
LRDGLRGQRAESDAWELPVGAGVRFHTPDYTRVSVNNPAPTPEAVTCISGMPQHAHSLNLYTYPARRTVRNRII